MQISCVHWLNYIFLIILQRINNSYRSKLQIIIENVRCKSPLNTSYANYLFCCLFYHYGTSNQGSSRLAQLFLSETDMNVSKWAWHSFSQVRLEQLLPSETCTIVSKRDWHNCFQNRLARLLSSETGTIVPKWDWHNCSQMRLAQLFPSETSTTVPK